MGSGWREKKADEAVKPEMAERMSRTVTKETEMRGKSHFSAAMPQAYVRFRAEGVQQRQEYEAWTIKVAVLLDLVAMGFLFLWK